ncbi:phosphoribosyltransferase [Gordonia sp. 'Campus']|uniref:phosphoribosyltransferase n=1 Tax=Gordonia sp. 'Campus' TaxID=2915824 RepID=UPI001EE3C836|nr:phosphoribosyltransferase family protein [Gordonia sp. 'Campus']
MSSRVFADRREAGRLLGARVVEFLSAPGGNIKTSGGIRTSGGITTGQGPDAPLVLGLARGGVPVAREVADAHCASLGPCDLDVLVVRKIGAPGHAEFAMGALTADHLVVNDDVPRRLGVSHSVFDEVADRERRLLRARERRYRGERPRVEPAGRSVVLVDDGLATGSSMAVAIDSVRSAGASSVIVAVPTAPADSPGRLRDRGVTGFVVLTTPDPFRAVGLSYDDFGQVDDDEVIAALDRG